MRKMKSTHLFFNLDIFNLEDFRLNLISLFEPEDDYNDYDFRIGVTYFVFWYDSNSRVLVVKFLLNY
jgi:hypothetical protein